jgi:hypothetical protein
MKTIIIALSLIAACTFGAHAQQQDTSRVTRTKVTQTPDGTTIIKTKHPKNKLPKSDSSETDINDSYNKTMDRSDVNGGNNADVMSPSAAPKR